MRKSIRVLAVVMALLMVMAVLSSCGTKLSGTYEGFLTTLTFDGDKVVASAGPISIEGTYKIDGDKITLTFGNDTLKLGGEHTFEKDGDTIKIGGISYTKQK